MPESGRAEKVCPAIVEGSSMNYRQALELAEAQHCREASAVVLQVGPDEYPCGDEDALVMCRAKVRAGTMPDDCNSDCPLKGKAK